MDQNFSNNQNDFLWTLLANPANDAHLYAYNLQRLVNDFPQSGILQALLAHASDEKNLKQASAYFSPKSLYKLINAPSSFIGVADEKIIIQHGIADRFHYHVDEPPVIQQVLHEDHPVNIPEPEVPVSFHSPFESVAEEPTHVDEHQPVIEHENTLHVNTPWTSEPHLPESIPEIVNHIPEDEPFKNVTTEISGFVSPVITFAEHAFNNTITENTEPFKVEQHIEPEIPTHAEPVIQSNVEPAWHTPVAHTEPEWHAPVNEQIAPVEPVSHTPVVEPIAPVETTWHTPATEPIAPVETTWHTPAAEPIAPAEPVWHTPVNEPIAPAEPVWHAPVTEPIAPFEPVWHTPVTEPITPAEPVWHAPVTEHYTPQPQKHIEEEVFDEITGIDQISIKPEVNHFSFERREEKPAEEKPKVEHPITDEAEKLIVGNIASTDFFMFDRKFGERMEARSPDAKQPAEPPKAEEITAKPARPAEEPEHQDVSKYHDEKMPYSFLWWLDKTRKEHAGTYQPYVAPPKPPAVTARAKRPTDELQQQYYENIFHITSVEELDKNLPPQTAPFNSKRKDQIIIERFIKEEPQIRPQSSDKLDNENKAKKSSEDRDELVTETLASIYSDQMLYHKAIASYKKLMLKFPEKSRYFASKIEQLEKKTN